MSNHASRSQRPLAQKKLVSADEFDADALFDEMDAEGKWFPLRGEEFFLPAPTAWPDAAFEAANRGDHIASAKLILGDAEYERFQKVGGNGLRLQRIVEKLFGGSMGESSGSSSS